MELEDLKGLIELLKDTDVTELQIEKEGTKVRIKRERIFSSLDMPMQKTPMIQETIIRETDDVTQRLITVTAPIVGIFYRSPSPESPPFIESGVRVKKSQVLCIIEAMKLMNEIESEIEGTVVKILVENGHPVEYGEPLFLIEPE